MKHLKRFNESDENIETTKSGGIQCDKSGCGWSDDLVPVEDYENWINKPCPECGSNLLTQEDYDKTQSIIHAIDTINSMTPEDMEALTKNLSSDDLIDAYLKLKEMGFSQNVPGENDWTVDFGKNKK